MDKEEIKNKLSAMKSSGSDSSSTAPSEGKTPSQMLAEYNARKAKKATTTDSDKAKADDIKAINEGKTSGTQRTQAQTDSLVTAEGRKWKENLIAGQGFKEENFAKSRRASN